MGCNSHLLIEYRWLGPKDSWMAWATDIAERRDYDLYGFLAGVRREGPPVVEPRGWPEDISCGGREFRDDGGSDYHTPTWLTPDEFRAAIEAVTGGVEKEWQMVDRTLQMLKEFYGNDGVRILIAFDN